MIEPICLEYQGWQIHSFRPEELAHHTQLIKEIYRLLTDQRTLQFLPEKRIHALAEAENWLKSAIFNYYCGKNFIHLITET
jgi:gamma-glutamyltranspeptidase